MYKVWAISKHSSKIDYIGFFPEREPPTVTIEFVEGGQRIYRLTNERISTKTFTDPKRLIILHDDVTIYDSDHK